MRWTPHDLPVNEIAYSTVYPHALSFKSAGNVFVIKDAVRHQDRSCLRLSRLIFALSYPMVHVPEFLAPGKSLLFSILVIAKLEPDNLIFLIEPDYQVKVVVIEPPAPLLPFYLSYFSHFS
jgi:hypothetical protein